MAATTTLSTMGSPEHLATNTSPALQSLNPAQTLADATDHALSILRETLKHPDDLIIKLPILRKKFILEKGNVEAQLKTTVEYLLDNTVSGLDLLSLSQNETNTIKKNLAGIDGMCGEARKAISNYTKIQKISKTHQNVLLTRDLLTQFQSLETQIQNLRSLLESDRSNPIGPADNLLYIHYQLLRLESFKNFTLTKAAMTNPEVITNLQSFFRKLDGLAEEFEVYVWKLAGSFIDLVKKRQNSVIVRIAKIMEAEEKLDEMLLDKQTQRTQEAERQRLLDQQLFAYQQEQEAAAKTNNKANKKSLSSPQRKVASGGTILPSHLISSRPVTLSTVYERPIKGFRSKLFDMLHESIANYFYAIFQPLSGSLNDTLEASSFLVEELTLVNDEIASCFPKKYNIFSFYVAEYHRHIFGIVNEFVHGKESMLEPADILRLLRWVAEYHNDMSDRLGVSEEMLEPRLLGGDEDKLIERYVKLIRVKIEEWLLNLLRVDTRSFAERDNEPETDTNGLYMMSAPVILFQMVNQQIDVVAVSSRTRLLYEVVHECCNALDAFQKKWLELMESEFEKWKADASTGLVPTGLPEWIIALANDHLRCTEYIETMQKRLDSLVDDSIRASTKQRTDLVLDAFMRLTKRAITILNDFIFFDTKPAWIKLHVLPDWYEVDYMKMIITTFDDYIGDYQKCLNDYLFQKLVGELQDRFLAAYLDALRNKGTKFKMANNITQEKLKADLDKSIEFFARYKSPKRVKASFDPIEKVIAVIIASPKLVFVDYYSLWKTYMDVPVWFVEEILLKRDDLDKSTVKEVMENCKKKIAEEKSSVNASSSTSISVFSKLEKAK